MTGPTKNSRAAARRAVVRELANRGRALLVRAHRWLARDWPQAAALGLLLVCGVSAVVLGRLTVPAPKADTVKAVGDLLLQIGAAFVGATTIAFTLVMFAMQVNVERMPYGLFRRFSGDRQLMGAFGLTFLLSMGVASLSLIDDASAVPWLLLALFWATVAILGLFLFAYRRAIRLISPAEQLQFIVRDAQRRLQEWDRHAGRVERRQQEPDDSAKVDGDRVAFFLANPRWTEVPRKSVEHAVAYARRYAEVGDYDVALVALNGVVTVNRTYIATKGRSFVPTSPFFDLPGADDAFLTHSLEQLRQFADAGLRRKDERQITLALEAFAVLSEHYAAVDYGRPQVMTHSHLALGYLTGAVKDVVPHGMTDVVMSGCRYIGRATLTMIARDGALDATSGIDALGEIGEAMAAKADSRPAAQIATEQLATATFALLLGPAHRARLALQSTTKAVMRIGYAVLAIPNEPLSRVHSTTLGAYFGLTSHEALAARVTEVANGALHDEADPARVADFIEGFHECVQVSREPLKALMLTATTLRSPLAFDLFMWIFQVAEVALALAGADKCPPHLRHDVERDGIGLGQLLTWLPDDAATLQHAENYNLTEHIFGLVVTARQRDSATAVSAFARILLGWTFKAGCATAGWSTLARGLLGLAALALSPEGPFNPAGLKLAILDEIAKRQSAQRTFDEAALELRRGHRVASSSSDRIEHAADRVPQDQLDALLREIADILSPSTSGSVEMQL